MKSGVKVKITGQDSTVRKIRRLLPKIQHEIADALYEEAEMILGESSHEVPRATGALAASTYIESPNISGDGVSIGFGYGGPGTKINPRTGKATSSYAMIVHERTDLYHPVGKAKYLEDPVNRAIPGFPARMAARLKTRLGW